MLARLALFIDNFVPGRFPLSEPGSLLTRYLPILQWGRQYTLEIFGRDLTAAVIGTLLLIPQSLAYALLAGLPAEAGLYASVVPIMLYAVFGTSRTMAVGPVALLSLMTASTIGQVAQAGTAGYATAALTLALLSGVMLMLMGFFRLGFLANFLSHPVISGFITASGIIIAFSQLKHILGVSAGGNNLLELGSSLIEHLPQTHWLTLLMGVLVTLFLFGVRSGLKTALLRIGIGQRVADGLVKAGPVVAVALTTWSAWQFGLADKGLAVVGVVPQSLPPWTMPDLSPRLLHELFVPALLISMIGFVESISMAQTLAARKRHRIDPDQELIGLGAANLGAAFTGGYPVTGGFSRSVVNFDAGAETPAAGAFTGVGLAIAALTITPLLYYLPKATLAATITVSVLSLVDLSILRRTWRYAKQDFAAVAVTMLLTLLVGVELGVTVGVAVSILLFLYKTSRPHIVEVGLVAGTEHYRNVERHVVKVEPNILSLRVDESLYFANARFLEDWVYARVVTDRPVRHVVLMCSAVNEIDMSALESLEAINQRLRGLGITLHLSEVKGPVMDRLLRTEFLKRLSGRVFLSQFGAVQALAAEAARLTEGADTDAGAAAPGGHSEGEGSGKPANKPADTGGPAPG